LDDEPPTELEAGHHRPHPGPPSTAARNVVVGTLIAFVVASNLGNIFLSVLVTERPLVFIGLNAQNRNLALASGELSAWSFYLVGFLRLVAPDPLFFLLGRWYGDAAIRWMERKAPAYGELLRMLERGFDKARFVVVAIAPNNPVSLFAGASGMSFGAFMAANVVGTIGRLALIRAFSSAFEGPLGSLKGFITDYRWPILGVSVVLVGLSMWSDRRGGRDGISDLAHLDDDIAEIEAELTAEDAALEAGADEGPSAGT
jgi:membrane protein DedA with SNARE-associated domain